MVGGGRKVGSCWCFGSKNMSSGVVLGALGGSNVFFLRKTTPMKSGESGAHMISQMALISQTATVTTHFFDFF